MSPVKVDAPPISLKQLAERLNLSPATVSLVVNSAPGMRTIALATRARVLAAAKECNYRPNSLARSLRTRQTYTVGVMVPELSEGYLTTVMSAVEKAFLAAGYLHFVVSHQGQPDLIKEYPRLLLDRFVDGLLLVNTALQGPVSVPAVSISGHGRMAGLTNLLLDHERAAVSTLEHLYGLGHRRIAFMRGHKHIGDSQSRWESTTRVARGMGLQVRRELSLQLDASTSSPELGFRAVKELLAGTREFTALVCFNDVTALGAMRAMRDAGLRCPEEISVVGFDDVEDACFYAPSLTTVRQPLRAMGEKAARMLIGRIQNPKEACPEEIFFEPELVVRESTGRAVEKRRQG